MANILANGVKLFAMAGQMNPEQIKAAILLAGFKTLSNFAEHIEERLDSVSSTIHYLRINQRIRLKIVATVPSVRFHRLSLCKTKGPKAA